MEEDDTESMAANSHVFPIYVSRVPGKAASLDPKCPCDTAPGEIGFKHEVTG